MDDFIFIEELILEGTHGVWDDEKKKPQKFSLSAKVFLDSFPCEDNLEKTISYVSLVKEIECAFHKKAHALIEILSEEIAFHLLLKYPLIKQIDLKIYKTKMKLSHVYDSIGVCISRKRNSCFISLGSNLGDRQSTIEKSIEMMRLDPFIKILKISNLIETKPFGVGKNQPLYLNAVLQISTFYTPEKLLNKTQNIENLLGRIRKEKGDPRTIDIDILAYNDLVIDKPELTLPHPRIRERAFVLEPWASIDSGFIHPVFKKNIGELKEDLDKTS